jgi:phenylacetate-CoA ligase
VAAELGERRARALGLRGVSVSSELSSAEERAKLGETFGCGVFDEYSTEELTRVAAQCDRGTYHLFEDVVLTEIVAADSDAPLTVGMRGEVVGTYLHAGVMPFIRYRQGDVAEISSAPCGCGRTTLSLGRLEGRQLDSFVLPSGRVLTSGYLLDATYAFLFDVGADLAAFRLVQTHTDRVCIEIVPGKAFVPEMSERIARHFQSLAGEPLTVVVDVVSSIAPSPAGKRQPIVSLVARAKA